MMLTTARTYRKVFAAALVLACSLPAVAHAEEDYCDKTRARAGADAALLYAPSIRVSGVKIPQVGAQVDPTSSVSTTYQVRSELVMSATNAYKGTIVESAADADCNLHRNAVTAQELLMRANDIGRLPALREQLAYLDAQKTAWDAIASKMQERLDSKTVTVIEVEDVKTRVVMFERQRAQVRGDLDRLVAIGWNPAGIDISLLSQRIEADQRKLEQELTRVRSVDPWDVSLMGGYVPPVFTSRNDWYGIVQLTYNLGGPWHGSRDNRYLTAREREVKEARYEMPHQLDVLKKQVAIAQTQARSELSVLTTRLAEMVKTREQLAQSESTLAPHAVAMVDLDLIAGNADKTYLEALVRELGRIQEK